MTSKDRTNVMPSKRTKVLPSKKAKAVPKAKKAPSAGAKKLQLKVKVPPQAKPSKGGGTTHASSSMIAVESGKGTAHISQQAKQKSKSKSLASTRASLKAGLDASIRTGVEALNSNICREIACESVATAAGYCRLHYIKNWKKVKRKELILKEGKLNQYIEELVSKYPDKYIEAIKQDLASDKEFSKVIHDLDLEEGIDDYDMDDSMDNLIDSIRRDFDDEGETF